MKAQLHRIEFDGQILQRGFWLYVWQAETKSRAKYYYVGRTGDSSSVNAQSPFNRMGQHLGYAPNSSMLRKYLEKLGVTPGNCRFTLVAHGPIFQEHKELTMYNVRRDKVAALEKSLAEAMQLAGYAVMNKVKSTKVPNQKHLRQILKVFSKDFPKLKQVQ